MVEINGVVTSSQLFQVIAINFLSIENGHKSKGWEGLTHSRNHKEKHVLYRKSNKNVFSHFPHVYT